MANRVFKQLTNNSQQVIPAGVAYVDIYSYSARKIFNPSVPGVLDAAGSLWMMGNNSSGQIGNAGVASASSPVQVAGLTQFNKVAADLMGASTFGLTPSGFCFSWGINTQGQLGQNSITSISTPTQVAGFQKFTNVWAADGFTFLLGQQGLLYAMGANANGELGIGSTVAASSPTLISGASGITGVVKVVQSVNAGNRYAHMVNNTGSVYATGANNDGQLGNGSVTQSSTFGFNIAFTFASPAIICQDIECGQDTSNTHGTTYWLTNSGAVYSSGYGINGELGDGTNVTKSSPVLVAGIGPVNGIPIAKIIPNNFSGVGLLTTAGTLYTFGANAKGQLGDGTVVAKSSPVLVAGGIVFVKVVASQNTTDTCFAGIDNKKQLWMWGGNSKGQLGNGTTNSASSPTLVSGFSFSGNGVCADVMVLSMGSAAAPSVYALATNGFNGTSWYAWGSNEFGQLGLNDVVSRSSPVQVVGLTMVPPSILTGLSIGLVPNSEPYSGVDLPTVTRIPVTNPAAATSVVAQFLSQGPCQVNVGTSTFNLVGFNVDKVFISYDQ